MTFSIHFLPGARRDFDESFDWYMERSILTAERFATAIELSIQRIQENPKVFAMCDRVNQSCPVQNFPFRIVFRTLPTQILIVAIAHSKRRPQYWRTRRESD